MKRVKHYIALSLSLIVLCVTCAFDVNASDAEDVVPDNAIELETINLTTRVVTNSTFVPPANILRSDVPLVEECVYPVNAPRAIIGSDNRSQITNTTAFPYCAICSLRIEWPNGDVEDGTGAVITRMSILTAGHCVYQAERGGYANRITVIPGRNGTEQPLGSYATSNVTILTKWRTEGGAANDAAFIKLNTNIGDRTGIMGYGNYEDSYLLSKSLRLTGYPGDKPSGTMWTHSGIPSSVATYTFSYSIDAVGGQSGAPVYIPSNNQVVGIHSRGNSSGNTAKRIDASFFSLLKVRKQEDS